MNTNERRLPGQEICLSACPFLPTPERGMDWRALGVFREGEERGAAFYEAALLYGQFLWMRGFAARAVLCLDRALGADLRGDETVLQKWPLPYAALAWIFREVPKGVFIGNPRVHFQHYAGRMNEPRREQRRWRAWACWAIVRAVMPELPGDPRHAIEEPSQERILAMLQSNGLVGESELWGELINAVIFRRGAGGGSRGVSPERKC